MRCETNRVQTCLGGLWATNDDCLSQAELCDETAALKACFSPTFTSLFEFITNAETLVSPTLSGAQFGIKAEADVVVVTRYSNANNNTVDVVREFYVDDSELDPNFSDHELLCSTTGSQTFSAIGTFSENFRMSIEETIVTNTCGGSTGTETKVVTLFSNIQGIPYGLAIWEILTSVDEAQPAWRWDGGRSDANFLCWPSHFEDDVDWCRVDCRWNPVTSPPTGPDCP